MLTQNIQVLGERNPKDKLNNIDLTRSVRLNDLTQEEMAKLYRRGQTDVYKGSLNQGFKFDYLFDGNAYNVSLDVVAITFDSETQAVVFDCGYSTVYNRYYRVLLINTDGVYSWNERISEVPWLTSDKLKTVNGQSLVGTGDIEIAAGVESLNGQTGSISLKTVNGNDMLGEGNVAIDTGVETLNGQKGALTLKTVNGNDMLGDGNIEIKGGVETVNGETGDVKIKTVNGQSLMGEGDVPVDVGVETLNGQKGALTLKTVNGNELIGTGDIEIKGGGDATPTGTTLYFTTTDGQTLNANIEATNKAGTVIEPSLKTPTAWYYDEIVENMNCPAQTVTSCNLYSLNGLNIPVKFSSRSYQHGGLRKILENCVYADLRKFFYWDNSQDLEYMFNGLKKLEWMDVSNFITSDVLHMSYMFANCDALTSLDLSKWDTSNVTNMSGMFNGCSNLRLLDVSNFNPSKVSSMNSMFQWCEDLVSLDLSKWNTSNVTNMGSMFRACRGLLSLDLSSFNTSKVTGMSSMFEACWRLTSLNLSNWDLANVTSMGGMFDACDALRTITMKNCSQETIDKIKAALTSANILNNVQIITA